MGCPPPPAELMFQLVVTVVWSIKLSPTGRSTLWSIPADERTSLGPIPDCWRMTGVLIEPVAMMTSRPALTVYVFDFSSRNSRPVARGVESLERKILPTLAPERTAVSESLLRGGCAHWLNWVESCHRGILGLSVSSARVLGKPFTHKR